MLLRQHPQLCLVRPDENAESGESLLPLTLPRRVKALSVNEEAASKVVSNILLILTVALDSFSFWHCV